MKTIDVDIVKAIINYVNNGNSNYKEFARLMSYEHRTLQQQFTKLCIAWLKELSETENYDLRNEGSVKFAKSVKDKLVNLPLI
jgi:hypothetical protein